VEVLHKSAVVLLVASWEAFVEDLILLGALQVKLESSSDDLLNATGSATGCS
jgi:hypothetical protein